MPKKKVEVYNKDQLIYPFIESDHVTFSNGMKVNEMLDQSISMPTVIHEDLSFKVGVGDQDVSSAIVDSSVAEMTIKGKTYQNILPEPSTHVLTNNKEMFKVNEGLDPNVEIVDGVSKSAILSGCTSFDVSNYEFLSNKYLNVNDGTFISGSTTHRYVEDYFTIPKGTQVITLKGNNNYKKICYYDNSKQFISGHQLQSADVNDFTTDVPTGASYFRFNTSLTTTAGVTIDEYLHIYLDGFLYLTNKEGYTEGARLISCKMPVLSTVGKNLFKDGDMQTGRLECVVGRHFNDSFTQQMQTRGFSQLIKVVPNQTITVSTRDANKRFAIYLWDINKCFSVEPSGGWCTDNRTITIPSDVHYMNLYLSKADGTNIDIEELKNNYQVEEGSSVTTHEPHKTNILSTPSDLELRGIGNVQDTLDCLTGEVTQRIGEIVFSSSDGFQYLSDQDDGNFSSFAFIKDINRTPGYNGEICDRLKRLTNYLTNENGIYYYGRDGRLELRLDTTNFISRDLSGLNDYLSKNPITVQYFLATPIIKTVDLSSSGNWEKIVLNGSENWNDFDPNYGCAYTWLIGKAHGFSNVFAEGFSTVSNYANAPLTISGTPNNSAIWLSIGKSIATLDQFKHYLSQNPVAVWYQTTTHLDSTQVKQPIFFKDGHIQLSSGAENSLIPTLDYQAKTSNSYVMDLMKTNTKYTMKAKTASGTFTIDGTSYGAGTNGTFTTPSSMTNKFLVMSNKTNEEVMILEGDVTDKTIPYFKGIKSAFEDEDKIEVLSTGKNLVDLSKGYHLASESDVTVSNNTVSIKGNNSWTRFMIPVCLKANTRYTLTYNTSNEEGNITIRKKSDGSGDSQSGSFLNTWGDGVYYVSLNTKTYVGWIHFSNIQLIEDSEGHLQYEPHKSNSTKIPLLSPLRSLPNGVKDELIIDRANNKVVLIQRIGEVVFDGSESLSSWIYNDNGTYKSIRTSVNNCIKVTTAIRDSVLVRCDKYIPIHYNAPWTTNKMVSVDVSGNIVFCGDEIRDTKTWINILKSNPTIVYYQLETPVITEVDLEGFPYVYKDGHIFLNSKIVPTTEIIYSVNQCQQISASNEDIIRHEKELTYLQKLIAQYVQVDYESVLLSLKV